MSKRSIFITVLILFNIAIDQISKVIVRAQVEPHSENQIFGKNFILTNVENSGAFLGLGSDLNPTVKVLLLLILPVIVLGLVCIHVFRDKSLDRFSLVGFCCIIGGGIANVYDRFVYGSVTDFLHIDLGGVFRTGIFNIADLSVTTGLFMLIYASFFPKKRDQEV